MLCSACGNENQMGNRFCGMCGTPLPHRPLTAPGAQGTHSFTRVPQERANPNERGAASTPAETISGPHAPSRTGVLIEMPAAIKNGVGTSQSEVTPAPAMDMDMVPEVPLEEYVKSFRYVPPADPAEITMRGDAHVSLPETPIEADASTAQAGDATTIVNPNSISPAEDVRERLGLVDSAPGDDGPDRPRFLDFSEPTPPPGEPATREPIIAGPSFLGLGDTPQPGDEAAGEPETAKPSRGSGWTWFAVAAVLVFAVLGVLEWRSQVNQTNTGPVEVVKVKLREMMGGHNSPPSSPGSTDTEAAKPAMQVEEQTKSQRQEQASASLNAPSAASTNAPAASDANTGSGAATSQPNTTPPAGTRASSGQKPAAAVPHSSPTGAQAASGQKTAPPKPTPAPETAKADTAPITADVPQPTTETPQPKPSTVPETDPDVPVKKVVPGAEEVVKANNASDSVAAAAWLWKAMAKGNPDAPVRLADMYVKGDGVPRSCEQALVLLQAAAVQGNARARNRLAAMHNNGTCVQRNR